MVTVARVAVMTALLGASLVTVDCMTATSLVVDVWSEIPCDKAARVDIMVGPTLATLKGPVASSTQCTMADGMAHMGSIVLAPRGSDESVAFAAMTSIGTGSCLEDPSNCIVAKREIAFVPHATLRMRIDLRAACLSVACDQATTCVRGACVPARVNSCLSECTELSLGLLIGLDAYWKLDGNAKDSSGHGVDLHASPITSTALFIPAKIGSGLFPRIAQTDYLCTECTPLEGATMPLLELSGDFTLALWALRAPSQYADMNWWRYGLLENGQWSFRVEGTNAYPTPAYPTFELLSGATVIGRVVASDFDMRRPENTNVWTHFIVYRRGDTLGMRVNGRETTGTVSGAVGMASTFYLGRLGNGYSWQGVIDEVGKWNRALSGAEMDELYSSGMGHTLP
jgi:hypothetical protein